MLICTQFIFCEVSVFYFFNQPYMPVFILLLVAIVLFITNKFRMDIVALLVMVAFSVTNILTTQEIFAGFSDPNIILIALLFIVGESLVKTGVAYYVSDWLMKIAGSSEIRVMVLLMLSVAGLGAFMSSTGVVAIFIPVVLAISAGMGISPRRMLMPLSVAGLISGMMTLIATAPNLVAHAELVKNGEEGFGFFSFTPIGLTILIIGIVYMLIVRRWLDNGEKSIEMNSVSHSMRNLIDEYHLNGRAKMVVIESASPFIHKTLNELKLRSQYQINVIAIQRVKHFRQTILSAVGNELLHEKDILLMDIGVDEDTFAEYCQQFALKQIALKGEYFSAHSKAIGMAEIALMPESESVGKLLGDLNFRSLYGVGVVAIKRETEILQNNLLNEPLKSGDILLVIGLWQKILAMEKLHKDFFLLSTPVERQQAAPALNQAPHALLAVATMVILMISGVVPNVIAALIACLMLGRFRCIDIKSAYESIHYPSLVLIVGMMPFSIALQKTGGVTVMVELFLNAVGGLGTYAVLFGVFAFTAIVGLFISNTATAILMAPIAIEIAHQLNYSATPLVMLVAVASSAAFMTPISSPVNTMVLAPAGYRFADFVKIGVPLTILVMVVSVFLVPLLFPL